MAFLMKLSAFIILLSVYHVQSRISMESESSIINSIFQGYDPKIRPSGKNGTGPVIVVVDTFIGSLSNVDDVNMVYDARLTFRQSWVDERLKYDTKDVPYVHFPFPNKLWTPDLFFSNENAGHVHNILTPNNLIRIYPDGRVLYSTRISLRLFCPMDLRNYPMDNQTCKIICASYQYTSDDLIFLWKDSNPIQIAKDVFSSLPKFMLDNSRTDYCTSKTKNGEFSCILLSLELSRNFFYHFAHAYMPTIALVLLSWIVFWLNPRCTTTRFGVWAGTSVSTVLIITFINSNCPKLHYVKALDVWMGGCICFLFCVLLELCIVNDAITKEENRDQNKDKVQSYRTSFLRWLNKYSTTAQRIDIASRFLFPAAFVFFNVGYWTTYAVK